MVVVGGTESSSNTPYVLTDARWGHRIGDKTIYDVLHKDVFMCPLAGMLMGATAEKLVEKYSITREEQDEFALQSHQKAVNAMEKGYYKEEVLPLEVKEGKKIEIAYQEEIPRPMPPWKNGQTAPCFQKRWHGNCWQQLRPFRCCFSYGNHV